MNLFRSIAAVIGTLAVALAAGSLFQPDPANERAASDAPGSLPGSESASLAIPISDAVPTAFDPARPAGEGSAAATAREARQARAQSAHGAGTSGATKALVNLRQLARAARQMPQPPARSLAAMTGAGNDDAANSATISAEPIAAVEECAVWLVVTPEPQAMLDLSLYAPCDGGARVEISHEGVHVSHRLDADGQLMLALPALAEKARVTLTLPDGRRAEDATTVPDIAGIDRLVLGWQGIDALGLNAHVDGAAHGAAGHVHPAQPGSAAEGAQHGFLTLLGDPALEDAALAQIYTFPAGAEAGSGDLDLIVEAAITEQSCGSSVSAETRLFRAGQPAAPRQLALTIPECDGFDGFLVIDGLIPDLTLAQN